MGCLLCGPFWTQAPYFLWHLWGLMVSFQLAEEGRERSLSVNADFLMFQVQESEAKNGTGITQCYHWWPACKIFASCLHNLIFYWSRRLCSKGINISSRRHNDDFIELENKAATWTLWAPCAPKSTKKRLMLLVEVTDPDFQGKFGLLGKEEYV